MNLKFVIQIVIGMTGYIAWAIMVFLDPTLRPDFLHFNITMALGTIGLVLRDMQSSAPKPPVDKEGGRAQVGMMALLAGVALALSGCASFQQAVGAYGASAVTSAQAANDNVIAGWSVLACATPFSAAVRHPEIVQSLKALCLPAGAASSPVTLLDGISTVKGVSPAASAP